RRGGRDDGQGDRPHGRPGGRRRPRRLQDVRPQGPGLLPGDRPGLPERLRLVSTPLAAPPVVVIVNPIARAHGGPAAGGARAALAGRVVAAEGHAGSVTVTAGPGDAAALARAAVAAGAGLVVAWGGDGTVNEVASALAFGPAALGIVPAGSGNGL